MKIRYFRKLNLMKEYFFFVMRVVQHKKNYLVAKTVFISVIRNSIKLNEVKKTQKKL